MAVCATIQLKSRDPVRSLARQAAFFAPYVSLPFDDHAADAYARIRADPEQQGRRIGPDDLLIAAIALAHDLTLVTHNTREFSRVNGLQLEDWQMP
jgi:tRNA(fMet)-specific endonuclease VapC